MVDSNCKGASVPDYNKSEGAKLGSFVINQRSGASKCRKTWNTTSHFDSQPLVNLVNYQSNFREEALLPPRLSLSDPSFFSRCKTLFSLLFILPRMCGTCIFQFLNNSKYSKVLLWYTQHTKLICCNFN